MSVPTLFLTADFKSPRNLIEKFARVRATSTIPRNSQGFSSQLPFCPRKKVRATSPEFARVQLSSPDFAILHPSDFTQKPGFRSIRIPEQNVGQVGKVGQVPFFQAFFKFEVGQLGQLHPLWLPVREAEVLPEPSFPFCRHPFVEKSGVKVRASSRDFDHSSYFVGFWRLFPIFPS